MFAWPFATELMVGKIMYKFDKQSKFYILGQESTYLFIYSLFFLLLLNYVAANAIGIWNFRNTGKSVTNWVTHMSLYMRLRCSNTLAHRFLSWRETAHSLNDTQLKTDVPVLWNLYILYLILYLQGGSQPGIRTQRYKKQDIIINKMLYTAWTYCSSLYS